jgi:hypothetical protein
MHKLGSVTHKPQVKTATHKATATKQATATKPRKTKK